MTSFEEISNVKSNKELHENVIYWTNDSKFATVNFTQGRYISRIRKMAEKYPDDVKIELDRNGVIIATVPVKAVKVAIRTLSDKQREMASERLKQYHNNKEVNEDDDYEHE